MKKLFFIFFMIYANSVDGQDSTNTHIKRFYIGISFSPDYCYRTLYKNDENVSDSLWSIAKELEDSVDVPKFGYTGGFTVGYYITDRISIESGLQFSNKGYKTIPIETLYDWEEPFIVATNTFNYYYLDIPLKVNYEFFKSKFQIITGIGVVGNYFLNATVKTVAEDPTDKFTKRTFDNDHKYNKLNISASFSLGMKYNINKRLNLRLEPVFKYALSNFNGESYKSTHLWNGGLQFSITANM